MRSFLLVLTILCTFSLNGWSRGGGGCFEQGTLIATPQGERAIETLHPGDWVWSNIAGKHQKAKVVATSQVTPQNYLELQLPTGLIHVTEEHLFAIKPGEFRRAGNLKSGDKIIIWQAHQWRHLTISHIKQIKAQKPAFNLLVDSGATYFANGVLVHNKGCFLPNTPILLANGQSKAINRIKPGDNVQAYEVNGALVPAKVKHVLTHQVSSYYVIGTTTTTIKVTGEHPFYVGNGRFKTVETLKSGDLIYAFAGNKLKFEPITFIKTINAKTTVYNLQTEEPHTYFAAGIAVHNKGGGGGHGGGFSHGGGGVRFGSNGNDDDWSFFLFIFAGVIIWGIIKSVRENGVNLDYNYSRNTIERKSEKTLKLLTFLSKQDKTVDPNELKRLVHLRFFSLQDCWMRRHYAPMKEFLMPDLFQQHSAQISGMIRNHEINRIDRLQILNIDLVNVRYTEKPNQREFTALITASARDFYVDDRTRQYLRGDESPATFQEFWTFQLQNNTWLLREIEQSRESDYLKEENFCEFFTDAQIEKIYQDKVDKLGSAGPWLAKDVEEKSNKVDRMLNFLVQSNKIWDKQAMLNRVRLVFTNVHLAFEAGELSATTQAELYPELVEQFNESITSWKALGKTIEYRNFCVRKVEILLVKSFDNKVKNEFTARVSAHAQRIQQQNGNIISRDEDVTPFEEYWTFGLLDGEWKLKEVMPKTSKNEVISAENLEEGSSPDLVKWYYTKKRAI
ncbi:polymorphic toxin-type HINT domain-containing protein [Legionella saoudiensis]|uniref:polymorphic toxin-type HINT domain-containing protein n=1 Tax=Legionella saoudiensis TaxID=1750561 RepID=UPI0018C245A9|nr:polymorphic toxin-type HINT domain-containing protein [Legionella saoudiensis]